MFILRNGRLSIPPLGWDDTMPVLAGVPLASWHDDGDPPRYSDTDSDWCAVTGEWMMGDNEAAYFTLAPAVQNGYWLTGWLDYGTRTTRLWEYPTLAHLILISEGSGGHDHHDEWQDVSTAEFAAIVKAVLARPPTPYTVWRQQRARERAVISREVERELRENLVDFPVSFGAAHPADRVFADYPLTSTFPTEVVHAIYADERERRPALVGDLFTLVANHLVPDTTCWWSHLARAVLERETDLALRAGAIAIVRRAAEPLALTVLMECRLSESDAWLRDCIDRAIAEKGTDHEPDA